MTREIKFRAWYDRQMTQPFWIDDISSDISGAYIPVVKWWKRLYGIEVEASMILMQYTWIKDCNWVEIYEGDIVRNKIPVINLSGEATRWGSTNKKIVKYVINRFKCGFNIWTSESREIIWNIYENPDLVSKK